MLVVIISKREKKTQFRFVNEIGQDCWPIESLYNL